MKKSILFSALCASLSLFVSCSSDDNGGGGGGGNVPIPIHATLYSAANGSNQIGVYNFTPDGVTNGSRKISSANNSGIFYIKGTDELIVNSVEQKTTNVYGAVKTSENGADLNLRMSALETINNPHDVAYSENHIVVSDGEMGSGFGKFHVFKKESSGLVLRNTLEVSFDVWGIVFIDKDLYATVAETNAVVVFKNFLNDYTANAFVVPNKRIQIEGINNIRGIGSDGGVVVLTDIGDENHASDGGFHFIANFVSKFEATPADGTLAFTGKQSRVWGNLTRLGNPVAIDYDQSRNIVFVAENKRDGGAILFFENVEAGGDLRPSLTFTLPKASSVNFQRAN